MEWEVVLVISPQVMPGVVTSSHLNKQENIIARTIKAPGRRFLKNFGPFQDLLSVGMIIYEKLNFFPPKLNFWKRFKFWVFSIMT